jgi:ferritin-like metal-binding protein YciE
MTISTLEDLFWHELEDIYSAEEQIIKALPKMAENASNPQLKAGFEEHLEQTRQQVKRLERIFEAADRKAKGKTCEGMKGLLEEGKEMMKMNGDPEVIDAGLILSAQKVEHYEIAAYGTVHIFARLLGKSDAEQLLEQTLNEEKQTDEKLTQAAKRINAKALQSR